MSRLPSAQAGSDLYVPFLVLVSRLWAAGAKLGGGGVTGSPVYFTPLDDGSVVAISTAAKGGETPRRPTPASRRSWPRPSNQNFDHSSLSQPLSSSGSSWGPPRYRTLCWA